MPLPKGYIFPRYRCEICGKMISSHWMGSKNHQRAHVRNNDKYIPCFMCLGKGGIPHGNLLNPSSLGIDKCKYCGGTGKLKKQPATDKKSGPPS